MGMILGTYVVDLRVFIICSFADEREQARYGVKVLLIADISYVRA